MDTRTLDEFKKDAAAKLAAVVNGDVTRSACGDFWVQKSFGGIEMSPAFARLIRDRLFEGK